MSLEQLPQRVETALLERVEPDQPSLNVVGSIWAPVVAALIDVLMDFLADCGTNRTQNLGFVQRYVIRRKVRRHSDIPSDAARDCCLALEDVITGATPEEFKATLQEFDGQTDGIEWSLF